MIEGDEEIRYSQSVGRPSYYKLILSLFKKNIRDGSLPVFFGIYILYIILFEEYPLPRGHAYSTTKSEEQNRSSEIKTSSDAIK